MEKKKNILIGALLVAIVLMSVGYAALAQLLTIEGTAHISADWAVEITNIEETAAVGATTNKAEATSTSATFDVNLDYPGAYAEYDVTISNNGNIDAILDSITGLETINAAEPTQIVYSITGVEAGTTEIAAKDGETVSTNVAKVRVEWVAATEGAEETVPTTTTKTATINLNYKQNTSN